jgi:hypothetical protein
MSDDLKFASPDELTFQWPRSEVRHPRPRPRPLTHPPSKQPISRRELVMLKQYRKARKLAQRWESGDEDVTMKDIIDVLLDSPRDAQMPPPWTDR